MQLPITNTCFFSLLLLKSILIADSFCQAKNVMTVAIGVGDYKKFEDQLVAIAGDHVYTLDDFDDLSDVFTDILKETCSKPVTQIISILNELSGFSCEEQTIISLIF